MGNNGKEGQQFRMDLSFVPELVLPPNTFVLTHLAFVAYATKSKYSFGKELVSLTCYDHPEGAKNPFCRGNAQTYMSPQDLALLRQPQS